MNLVRASAKVTGSTSCTAANRLTQQADKGLPHTSQRVRGSIISKVHEDSALPGLLCYS